MPALIGRSIGRYHILDQLGEGGMATVYKAFDSRLEREVAVKVILPSRQQAPKFLKRFEREAKALEGVAQERKILLGETVQVPGLRARPLQKRIPPIALAVAAALVLSIVGLNAAGIIDIQEEQPVALTKEPLPAEQPAPLPKEPAPTEQPVALPLTATAAPIPLTTPGAVSSLAGALCEDPLGCIAVAPDEPIRLGYILFMGHALGVDLRRGIEIALDDAGLVLGHAVELVGEDGNCDQEGGRAAAERLAADESLLAVVGTTCSAAAEGAAPILDEAGMTMISPSAVSPILTSPGSHIASFLRTSTNDALQGRLVAEFAFNELALRSAAAIHYGDAYTSGLVSAFSQTFESLGGRVLVTAVIEPGVTDIQRELSAIAVESPGLIYYPTLSVEGSAVMVQAKETAGLEEAVLMGSGTILIPGFVEAAGQAVEGMYISSHALAFEADGYEAFLEKYQAKYGEQPPFAYHAYAYDATRMILDAIERVALQDEDGSIQVGRQALRDALYATQDFEGLTGTLNCSPDGDCGVPRFVIHQVQNGELVQIYEPPLASP